MNTLSARMLPEFEQEMANTRKILEKIPEDKFDFKPHEKSMSLGHLAGHVAELSGWGTSVLETELLTFGPEHKPFDPKTRKEVLDLFEQGVKKTSERLAEASDEHLSKNWTLKFGDYTILSMPRADVLRSVVLNHVIHHRAQLGVYLRLNDIALPGMYGPSADETFPPQAHAQA